MRSLGRVLLRSSAVCKPYQLPATSRWQAARTIYTSINDVRPYGFAPPSHAQQQQQQQQQSSSSGSSNCNGSGSTGFLPVPFVTEQLAGAHHSTDLFSKLLKERIVALYGPVEDRMAATVTASLLFLESDSDAPISLYINSPGGSVSAGLSIYDTMQYITAPVHTIVLGQAASMGSLLAAAGSPGHRYVLPHATIMMHQPSGGYSGTTADIQIHAKEILRIRGLLNDIYADHINHEKVVKRRGKTMDLQEIERLMDRDYFMSAQEAVELGVADEVLVSRKKLQKEEEK